MCCHDTWNVNVCLAMFRVCVCVLFFASHFACRSYFARDNAKRKGPFGDIAMVVHNGCACIGYIHTVYDRNRGGGAPFA